MFCCAYSGRLLFLEKHLCRGRVNSESHTQLYTIHLFTPPNCTIFRFSGSIGRNFGSERRNPPIFVFGIVFNLNIAIFSNVSGPGRFTVQNAVSIGIGFNVAGERYFLDCFHECIIASRVKVVNTVQMFLSDLFDFINSEFKTSPVVVRSTNHRIN